MSFIFDADEHFNEYTGAGWNPVTTYNVEFI